MSKLKDIAKITGVSISTVSKALNNSSEIKRETKARIIKVAQDLNYEFNPGKPDSKRKNRLIGVICPEVNSNYYTQLISSVGTHVVSRGYQYIVAISDFRTDKEERYLELLGNSGVDGIIFITENKNIEAVMSSIKYFWNIPLVLIAADAETDNFDCIRIDDCHGVVIGVEHLIKLSHSKIGYIGDHLTESRLKTYREVLARHGIPVDQNLIQIPDTRFEECGYKGMKAMLGAGAPTAVFAAYDDIAIGAMRAISEHGLSIPEDISVIGMDNVTVCPYLTKSLTTVSNPIKEMAAVSVSILSHKIEDRSFTVVQHVALKPELIVRETTAALAKD
jgi:DNA-binding LacI/PurR family transcriptional regulator